LTEDAYQEGGVWQDRRWDNCLQVSVQDEWVQAFAWLDI